MLNSLDPEKRLDTRNFEPWLDPNPYEKLFSDLALGKLTGTEARDVQRYLCENDLYFLMRYAYNRDDMADPWIYEKCRMVQRDNANTVDLWFRGGYKSTIITHGLNMMTLLRHPYATINIFSFVQKLAYSFVTTIRHDTEQNEYLQRLYPDIIPPAGHKFYTNKSICTLKHGGRRKEHSLTGSGITDGMPTGMHYDVLHYDDIVTETSVTTPDQLEKTKTMLRLSFNLSARRHIKRIVGTTYSHSDIFSEEGDDPALPADMWKFRRIPVIIDGETQLLTDEEVADKRRTMGAYIFSTQMMLDPSNPEDRRFEATRIDRYTELPEDRVSARWILCDPAISRSKKACRCVVMYVVVTNDHHIYLERMVAESGMRIGAQVDAIIGMWLLSGFRARIGIETVGYQESLRQSVEDRLNTMRAQRRIPFVPEVSELKADRSKFDRIMSLQPYVEQGQIHVRAEPSYDTAVDEFTNFPHYKYRDIIDTLSYITQVMPSIRVVTGDLSQINRFDRFRDMLHNGDGVARINRYRRPMWQNVRRTMSL